jgi:putative membrane protein
MHPRLLSPISLSAAAVVAALATGLAPAQAASSRAASDQPNAQDRTWVSDSAEGDLFEVAGGRLAMRRSHDPAVRRFGHRMVVDHTRLYRKTARVADALGLDVPTQPSRGQRAVLDSWRTVTGHAFICAYVPYEWEDHQLDISDAQDEVADGQADAAVSDARSGLPVLHEHLDLVSKLLHHPHC